MTQAKTNAIAFAKLIGALHDGPCTILEMVEVTGLHRVTIEGQLRALRREGLVHICGWEKDRRGRYQVKVFLLGRKRDVPAPPPKKASVRTAEYRQRKTALNHPMRAMARQLEEAF